MSVKYDYLAMAAAKAFTPWLIETLRGMSDPKGDHPSLFEHLVAIGYEAEEVGEGEEVEVSTESGSGSLFSLSAGWEVLAGEVTIVSETSSHWSAGFATSDKSFARIKLGPGAIVKRWFFYSASPAEERRKRVVYFRPPG